MFTGKRPTDEMFRDGFGIHSYVQTCSVDRVLEMVDPSLLAETETAMIVTRFVENHKLRECLFEVLNVGVACSVDSAKERMSISDVVVKLQSIRDCVVRENANRE